MCYDRTNSRAIGYYATQQNAAYNHGVDVLNREPELPKRSGRNHPDAINKRITAWRQDTQKGPTIRITSTGKAASRRGKSTSGCSKVGPSGWNASRRPTTRAKSRNIGMYAHTAGPWLTVPVKTAASASPSPTSGYSKSATTARHSPAVSGFTARLRAHQTLKWLDIRSIRLVPVENYGPRTPLRRRHYCLHVQVAVPEPMPINQQDIESPEDILGADRGAKNHLAASGSVPSSSVKARHPF